ncbi:substrate-binding periplasmic protein [Halobacteriovorax sp.]|uniref:substrate-binding periplasmic protein n=1 Tax=Halobacteriovorax sp. TaxID=2020862 RepID=UPI003561B062
MASPPKQVIRIGTTTSLNPYLYKETFSGVEIDLIKEAFIDQGYKKFSHIDINFKRSFSLLIDNDIDAISSNKINNYYTDSEKIFSSKVVMSYIDCAITLRKRNLKVSSFKDFAGKRVWAFKTAKESLGKEYANATELASEYNQNINQLLQPKALHLERTDIAISDINIFMAQALKDNISKDNYRAFNLLKPTPRVLRFNNKDLRDTFNKGLNNIRKNGKYKNILKKYKGVYTEKCG